MKRILFVEDNETLLELYSIIMSTDPQWQTSLAPNGQEAMKVLTTQAPFNVVVSDMQMPGMSGIEVLSEVRKLQPQAARIIVSGASDQAIAADSLNCTHLFISKPFEAKTLRDTLNRVGSLDAYLKDEKLKGLAGKMRALPSFPKAYMDIIQEMESDKWTIQSIGALIAKDPAIAAKVLQVANSVAMGQQEQVTDIADAVQVLGMNTVKSIALSTYVYTNFKPGKAKTFSADALWNHLMKCGTLAKNIMRKERAQVAEIEEAYTAGILHDIGKLMLSDSLPQEFEQALALAKKNRIPLFKAEQDIFGATHTGLAAYLFSLWGLPASIVEAVAFHHEPEKSTLKKFSPLTAIHVADALCDTSGELHLNQTYLQEVKKEDRIDEWKDLALEMA
jgi:HD-like signal output (HDOD) protein/ActR/RegA family two-component response regulator